MSCPGGTYRISFGVHETCIPYYIPVNGRPGDPPPVDRDWGRNIAILAVINELVHVNLSEQMRAPMLQAIRSVSQEIQKQLPEEVSFQLNGQEDFACENE